MGPAAGLAALLVLTAAAVGEYIPGTKIYYLNIDIIYIDVCVSMSLSNFPMSRTPKMPLILSGTPGSVWTKEQVEVVREKVREMVNVNNWWGVDTDTDIDINIVMDV